MKQLIYAKFCEYSPTGISYLIHDEYMREHLDSSGEYTFVTEIDVPEIDNSEVVKMGVKSIDESIAKINAESHREIEALKAKKEQLLALTHDSGE